MRLPVLRDHVLWPRKWQYSSASNIVGRGSIVKNITLPQKDVLLHLYRNIILSRIQETSDVIKDIDDDTAVVAVITDVPVLPVLHDDGEQQIEDDEDIIANGPPPRGDYDAFSAPLKRTRREYLL